MSKGGSRCAPLFYFFGWKFLVDDWIFSLLPWSLNRLTRMILFLR